MCVWGVGVGVGAWVAGWLLEGHFSHMLPFEDIPQECITIVCVLYTCVQMLMINMYK